MKQYRLSDFTKGWVIGDFLPSIVKTQDCEVAIKRYQKADIDPKHHHKKAEEITVIVSGKYKLNELILEADDIVHIDRDEPAEFECLEDGVTVVVKLPSVAGDKYVS
ncbi:hypothetical protein BH09PAT2_BH09PAT2_10690 [soil metagenome]